MKEKFRILIVEDEDAIRTGLIDVFLFHGYDVDFAVDGESGLSKACGGQFDLVLLDVMLPGIDGFEICNRVREHDKDQPIIMLTAKTSDEDIIKGLSLGADDYVAKPFSVAQLVLRVEAVLRRTHRGNASASMMLQDGTTLDPANLCGKGKGGESLTFTRREMALLQYLAQHTSRAVPREELLHKVWGYAKGADIETRTIDIHIAKLRRKLEANPAEPEHLLTVRGAGYRLLTA